MIKPMMKTLFVMFCIEQLILILCKWNGLTTVSWWLVLIPAEIAGVIVVTFLIVLIIAFIKGFNE